jgi:hypothetical protein
MANNNNNNNNKCSSSNNTILYGRAAKYFEGQLQNSEAIHAEKKVMNTNTHNKQHCKQARIYLK